MTRTTLDALRHAPLLRMPRDHALLAAAGLGLIALFTFRLVTFWLPIIPGAVALRLMRRRGEL